MTCSHYGHAAPPCRPTELAEDVVAGLRQLNPHRSVHVSIQEWTRLQRDPGLLRQVFENLLSNAWKYSSKTPNARIEMGISEVRNGKPVYFVKDNGAGFDMRHASKLFTAFQRLHHSSDFPGTGVGLATVQRILARHGGEIWAEGAIEKGAAFYFTIPAVGEIRTTPAPPRRP